MNELQHQIALMSWARKTKDPRLDFLFHIPNGGFRHKREAAMLKASGVRAGVPDLFLPFPAFGQHGLWIELKAPGGKLDKAQAVFIDQVLALGYGASVAYGWRSAADIIENYLGQKFSVDRDSIDAKFDSKGT